MVYGAVEGCCTGESDDFYEELDRITKTTQRGWGGGGIKLGYLKNRVSGSDKGGESIICRFGNDCVLSCNGKRLTIIWKMITLSPFSGIKAIISSFGARRITTGKE